MRLNMDDTETDESGTYVVHDGVRYTGEVVETAEDGFVIGLSTYRDGLVDGPQREWYYEGPLRSEYQAAQGKATGVARSWHENGQLSNRSEFDQYGVLRKREEWDENGNPQPGRAIDSW